MQDKNRAMVKKILLNLAEHFGVKGIRGLADFLGQSEDKLYAWIRRGSIADSGVIFAKCPTISLAWLQSGEGPMLAAFPEQERELVQFLNDHESSDVFEVSETLHNQRRALAGQACQAVNIYNMVSGGPGAVPEWHEPVDRRAIPAVFIKPNIRPVLVRGRSMEPTFKNGAIIGVDEEDKQVIEGEAYAIVLPYSGAAVKRLYPLPDGVLIRSDNKEFPEVTLRKEDIPDYFILGRVCWVVQEV